jgi:hypothetical protein
MHACSASWPRCPTRPSPPRRWKWCAFWSKATSGIRHASCFPWPMGVGE